MSMWTCPKCGKELTRKDQQHYCLKPQSIDAYISLQDASVRPRQSTIHFAASKKHIGHYPGDEATAAFADRLSGFDSGKGTIRLPHDRELIRDVAVWCYEKYAEGRKEP